MLSEMIDSGQDWGSAQSCARLVTIRQPLSANIASRSTVEGIRAGTVRPPTAASTAPTGRWAEQTAMELNAAAVVAGGRRSDIGTAST